MVIFINFFGGKLVVFVLMVDVCDVSLMVLWSFDVELGWEELVIEYLVVGDLICYDDVVEFVKIKYFVIFVNIEGLYDEFFIVDMSCIEKEFGIIWWYSMEEMVLSVLD